jgi:hypothetical protein
MPSFWYFRRLRNISDKLVSIKSNRGHARILTRLTAASQFGHASTQGKFVLVIPAYSGGNDENLEQIDNSSR